LATAGIDRSVDAARVRHESCANVFPATAH
jgi:hypothetical protein